MVDQTDVPRAPKRASTRYGVVISLAVTALVAAATLVVAPVAAVDEPAVSTSTNYVGPNIEIVQTPSSTQGQCLPRWLALSYTVQNTAETFTLRVRASAPLCDPVTNAVAAVYEMPGNGVAWPQELRERVPFEIRDAGITQIIFTKTCVPTQFDVVTGATPQTIAPWGEWHGPLLFPFATATTLQHWGWDCPPPTTTTSTTSTTSTTTTSTTSTTTTTPPTGTQGCTPGYWRQSHHLGSWAGFAPTAGYDATFGVVSQLRGNPKLLDAVSLGGGGSAALARHATAALLNASSPDVDFLFSVEEVRAIVATAYTTKDFESAKNMLERENERGCPLGREAA